MGNYDHSVQRNIDKKLSQFGMMATTPATTEVDGTEKESFSSDSSCSAPSSDSCVRAMEYLRRIIKSLMRQMNVQSHVFGPGEAITIDLQAELKYDDYIVLTKFANSNHEFDKYLYRIDEIMSNFIHVVEHPSSRFDFLDRFVNFPAFYSLKFWVILFTSMVIGLLVVLLFVKAFNTRQVFNQLLYGFLIIFILSCVWSYSSMYEDKKAEIMTHMVQSSGIPPKDCDFQNWTPAYSVWYWIRVNILNSKDQCEEYYRTTMTDPFWKVNPMEAISTSVAYFFFTPMGYMGRKLGEFFTNFIEPAPWLMKPVMLVIIVFIIILLIIGPFRISTPLLTIEPAWRPELPALESRPMRIFRAIGHERVRNEIMERPDGPVIKSVRDATTDMDGFQEYLTDEGNDELEIVSPFARFNIKDKDGINSYSRENKEPISVSPKEYSSQPGAGGRSVNVYRTSTDFGDEKPSSSEADATNSSSDDVSSIKVRRINPNPEQPYKILKEDDLRQRKSSSEDDVHSTDMGFLVPNALVKEDVLSDALKDEN